jgi:hypothetical protein
MTKYRLQVYGWEVDAMGHTLTDEQVQQIKDLMEENGYDQLWECRTDLEELGIVEDIYNPELFHVSRALDNGSVFFKVYDENEENVICEFEMKDLGDFYEVMGDDETIDAKYPYENYFAVPEIIEGVDNVLFIADENKGGITQFIFESDTVPTPQDFCVLGGSIETPEGEWDIISKYFYKGELLEVEDHLDNSGKASTMEIYTKDGDVIK